MRRLFKNPFKSAVVLIIIAIFFATAIHFLSDNGDKAPASVIRQAEKKLVSLRENMLVSLDKISRFTTDQEYNNFFSNSDREKSGYSYYVLRSGVLTYWSDNEPAISDSILATIGNGELLKLSNGDFLAFTKTEREIKTIGLILIKHSYKYENKYLINKFNPALGIESDFSLADDGDTLHLPGNIPAYILKHDSSVKNTPPGLIVFLFFAISAILLLSVYLLLRSFSKSTLQTVLFISLVLILRTLMIYLKIPGSLYDHGIFSPTYYASSFFFNSLGDMLFNSALLLVLSISLYENNTSLIKHRLFSIFLWVVSAVAIHFLIRGLVINSKISFELSSPADINLYSILAFTSISVLLLCFLFITAYVLKIYRGYFINGKHAWIGITVCAIYTSITLTAMNREKEQDTRKLFAQKAEMSRDHVAEYLIGEQEEKISMDNSIDEIIRSGKNVNEELSAYLGQKYFSGYLSKFELNARYFDESNPSDSENNPDYYSIASENGKPTYSKNLFFLSNETGGTSYLELLPLNDSIHKKSLVLLLTARFLQSAKGFPELFISGSNEENSSSAEYSLARYSGKSLVYEYGNYIYPLTGKEFMLSENDNTFITLNGYSHLIHRINENSFVVVSRPKENFLSVLTMFSWMFIFLSVSGFFLFVFSGFFGKEPDWKWTLTRRVQASVIFLVVLAFVLVGSGTIYYINRKYTNDLRKSISDQVNALWFMVNENLFATTTNDNKDSIEQYKVLDQMVQNTNIDFNMYDAEGRMIYSSQPKIFEKGIVSVRMNPGAYFTIKDKGLTQFIHPENAGLLNYISAYAPFTDRSGKIIAFLNLPYFEKQNELNKDVSVFLSALVNIYVLLFALAVFVTIFISSQITKPLLLIRERMSGIKLGSSNEKIAYSDKDEIGQLVHEYNRMIDELSVSAELLARSERESAWREMARQVAHEIKNPLTPMKLSVQHLHRAIKDKGFGDDPIVDRISSTLIQQIDTLSNIATAFSNFAKMPQPVPVKINLKEIIQQVTQLYADSIDLDVNAKDDSYFVLADRDQLIGVFSNLLKNAVQSITDDRIGKVNVTLSRKDGWITIEIADNGIGIPEDQRDKIFIPSFTTKSSGMGLGLAIVRNIVEEASGKIWFTSTYKNGSSFFVSFPDAG